MAVEGPARPINSALRIYRAQPEHAALILPLARAHAEYEQLPFSEHEFVARLTQALSDNALHIWLVFRAGQSAPVAYCSARADFSTLTARAFLHMDCLFVMPDARGAGIGEMLMRHIALFAHETGCTQLQWQTPDWNTRACAFYQRLGANAQAKHRFTWSLPA